MLLGRWQLVAERHGGGCSCCPGLGDVPMDEVERRVVAWLRKEHGFAGEALVGYLRGCITGAPAEERHFSAIGEALDDLERIQSGMHF
jgi:hypothetical protein